MSRITIIQADGNVGVDGLFRNVDLSELDPAIHAVQFNTITGVGEVEWDADASGKREPNTSIDSEEFDVMFQVYVDRWYAAAPPAPQPKTADEVWGDIKAERDRRKSGGVMIDVSGVNLWFHSDDPSRIQQLGLKDQARDVLAAGGSSTTVLQKLGQNIQWKTMTGAYVPMTVQLAIDIVNAVGDLDAILFYVAGQHEAAMRGSATPHTYDYSTGWPQSFAEWEAAQ